MSIEITNEPQPPPRPSGLKSRAGCRITLIEESSGKVISETITPDYIYQNERQTRDERKY